MDSSDFVKSMKEYVKGPVKRPVKGYMKGMTYEGNAYSHSFNYSYFDIQYYL